MNAKHRRQVNRTITIIFVASACWLIAAQPAISGEGQPLCAISVADTSGAETSPSTGAHTVQPPRGASGLLIHIDPQTGAILKQRAPGTVPLQLTPQTLNALSTSDQGLVEVPSPVQGGGFLVDVQGRFQNPLFGTVGPDGKFRMRHLHEIPATESDK